MPGDKNSPLNEEMFGNLRAQAWWSLRRRFELAHRARTEPGFTYDVDDLISISGDLPLLRKLEKELSQPTVVMSSRMKLLVDKKPEGSRSPNLADATVQCFFPVGGIPLNITPGVLARSRVPMRRKGRLG